MTLPFGNAQALPVDAHGWGQEETLQPSVRQVQLSQAAPVRSYSIPPGPLAPALNRFADESRVQLVYDANLAANARTAGVQGTYTADQALQLLLAGSGIAHRFVGADVVTLQQTAQQGEGGAVQLGPITVEGQADRAIGPETGFVAERSLVGTKTDTPLLETPQSVSVITQDRLQTQDVSTINEALRYTPGVQGEVFGNDSRVDFLQYRGFDEGGTGVFRDGLQLRSSGFSEFRPELYGAQRVEVLRGPSSVLYGQSPPGGLVNIISKRPPRETLGEVSLEGGTFDLIEGKVDVGGPIAGSDTVFYRMTGLARDSESQVEYVDDNRVFLAPALTWRPKEGTELTFLSSYQHDETGSTNQFLPAAGTVGGNPNGNIPLYRFAGETDFDEFDRTAYAIGYDFEHRASDTWTVRQTARYDRLNIDSESVFGGGLAADQRTLNRFAFATKSSADLFTVDNRVQADVVTGPAAHKVLLGVDYQRYDVEEQQRFGAAPSIDVFNPSYGAEIARPPLSQDVAIVQDQVGLYLQEQLTLYDKVVVTLGGRQDFVFSDREDQLTQTSTDQDDSEFSWRAGIAYLFDVGLAPYFSYSESFVPIVGTNALGEPFEPEQAQQFELGVKYQPPGASSFVTVAVFDLTRENVRTPDETNPFNQVQTGEVRSRGVEVEGVASFDFGLNVIAAYTFQDVEITKSNAGDEGNRPTTVPEHFGALWVDYTIPTGMLSGLRLGSGVRSKGETFGNAANTLRVDDYVLFDAAVSYQWRDFTLGVVAKNLAGTEHVAACSSASACFYGSDRTITGALRYSW